MSNKFDPAIGNETRWKKGCVSPNPGGRPNKTLLSDAFREVLAEPFPGDKKGRTYAEVIAHRIATDAAKGNIKAIVELGDRTEGKVRTGECGMESTDLDSLTLGIQDQGDAYENFRIVTERLRHRIAVRRAQALGESSQPVE